MRTTGDVPSPAQQRHTPRRRGVARRPIRRRSGHALSGRPDPRVSAPLSRRPQVAGRSAGWCVFTHAVSGTFRPFGRCLTPFEPRATRCHSEASLARQKNLAVLVAVSSVAQCPISVAECLPFHRAFNSYGPPSMRRKKRAISDQKARVCARFDQKRSKSRAFCLTHFNIWAPNRPWSVRIDDSGLEKARFGGVRKTAFS